VIHTIRPAIFPDRPSPERSLLGNGRKRQTLSRCSGIALARGCLDIAQAGRQLQNRSSHSREQAKFRKSRLTVGKCPSLIHHNGAAIVYLLRMAGLRMMIPRRAESEMAPTTATGMAINRGMA
jgi:hypothetical protein